MIKTLKKEKKKREIEYRTQRNRNLFFFKCKEEKQESKKIYARCVFDLLKNRKKKLQKLIYT